MVAESTTREEWAEPDYRIIDEEKQCDNCSETFHCESSIPPSKWPTKNLKHYCSLKCFEAKHPGKNSMETGSIGTQQELFDH